MTLLDYTRATELSWAEMELAAERLLEAIARRHAAGSGGPCGAEDAEIDEQVLKLPVTGQAGSDAEVSKAAGQAVWELLANRPWADAEAEPDREAGDWIRARWPGCTPAHQKVIDRALSSRAPRPDAVLKLWREVRAQGAADLQPLRLRKSARRDAATTGLFGPSTGPQQRWIGTNPSVFDEPAPQSTSSVGVWIVVALLSGALFIGVCAAGFGALGWLR